LPANLAFIHGHRVSHHTYQLDIVPAVKAVRWGSRAYIPLNVHMYQRVDASKPEFDDMKKVWPKLFTSLSPEMPKTMYSWCCAQFVVTRAAIRARPKEFYQDIYDWMTNEGKFKNDLPTTSYISSRVLEQTWHMIFGMPAESEMIPPCEIFDCDILDEVTKLVETWEGTPFDRIPCKVYEVQHLQDKRARISTTYTPGPGVYTKPTIEELKAAEKQRQLMEEGNEVLKDKDIELRKSGELWTQLKGENQDVTRLHLGFGRVNPPEIPSEPWKP
jgi:hypothetical protein